MPEIGLNEIVITPRIPDVALALRSDLYDIESNNTTEARIQSASTDNGNEHTVTKLSNESLIATKIPSGIFELFTVLNRDEEAKYFDPLLLVNLKA